MTDYEHEAETFRPAGHLKKIFLMSSSLKIDDFKLILKKCGMTLSFIPVLFASKCFNRRRLSDQLIIIIIIIIIIIPSGRQQSSLGGAVVTRAEYLQYIFSCLLFYWSSWAAEYIQYIHLHYLLSKMTDRNSFTLLVPTNTSWAVCAQGRSDMQTRGVKPATFW